ncbi:MAG: OmpA family protein [Candidatus Korobacteraceae bacterium]|jgi:outer membrane protein OmpA-like peptidoglycan-associated protein
MKKIGIPGITFVAIVSLTTLLLCGIAIAQSVQVQGVIDSRSGATMTVKSDTGNVVVLLTDSTDVQEVEGGLHMRKKQMGMTALVPGLSVQVKGSNNAQNQLVADSVRFKGSDLKTAQDIQAGVNPAEQQLAAQQQQLQQTEQQMQQQQAAMQAQQAQLTAEQQKIAANKAAISAANKRFGELGEYNILGEVTVLFANGKVAIEPQYKPQLLDLAKKALTVDGYVIQVKGYASAVGSAALNQKLSTERANNVTEFLEQQGRIPLTNLLAPGAMGTARQVAPDNTAEGQADNRRVVVRILQNKGIAGN